MHSLGPILQNFLQLEINLQTQCEPTFRLSGNKLMTKKGCVDADSEKSAAVDIVSERSLAFISFF